MENIARIVTRIQLDNRISNTTRNNIVTLSEFSIENILNSTEEDDLDLVRQHINNRGNIEDLLNELFRSFSTPSPSPNQIVNKICNNLHLSDDIKEQIQNITYTDQYDFRKQLFDIVPNNHHIQLLSCIYEDNPDDVIHCISTNPSIFTTTNNVYNFSTVSIPFQGITTKHEIMELALPISEEDDIDIETTKQLYEILKKQQVTITNRLSHYQKVIEYMNDPNKVRDVKSDQCSICLSDESLDRQCLFCNKPFHDECIQTMNIKSKITTCPMCKHDKYYIPISTELS